MSKREYGYYWIKPNTQSPYQPALWDGNFWTLIGSVYQYEGWGFMDIDETKLIRDDNKLI